MTGKIINAFGRKEGDEAPAAEAAAIVVDETSLKLLEQLKGYVTEGKLRNAGFIGIFEGTAIAAINPHGANVTDLAVINLAADALKDQVQRTIKEFAYSSNMGDIDGDGAK